MNTIERTRPLFMFVHLTNRMKFLVHVRSFIKRTNINELPAERFTNCSLNVRFVYSHLKVRKHTYDCKNITQDKQ
ncbi:hypothetical protein HanIR_Chr04g0190701 [Helianthus annuus]|nr:hypothetical protein HanIR_Chr04g0190701 [Helianthus annuus]